MVKRKNIKKQQKPVEPVEVHLEEEEAAPDAAAPDAAAPDAAAPDDAAPDDAAPDAAAPDAAAPVPPSSASSGHDERGSTGPTPKKKYRPTHSEIKDYHFNDEQVQMILDFLKDNPCLYNKKEKFYHNNTMKLDLWRECALMFPDCTYLQVRKFFEKKRTAFGKIENAEMRSGADVRPRTAREEEIMTHWGFFRGHIAHAPTLSTQTFDEHDDSSSSSTDTTDMSAISAASIERRKQLKKRHLPDSDNTPEPAPAPAPAPAAVHVNPGERFIERMFEKASAMMQNPTPSTSHNNVEVFSRLIFTEMQDLNCDEQDACMIELLTVVKKYKSRRRQQTAQQEQQTAQQEQQPFYHTQPHQQQQQYQHFQPPQPPRPQTPAAWMQRPPYVPPIPYQQQPLTQPQYLPPTTYVPYGHNTTYQQHQQYAPQQTFVNYCVAPSSSAAQTITSPTKSTFSDSRISLTPLMQDLDIPTNITNILATPETSLLTTPQNDPDEPPTTT